MATRKDVNVKVTANTTAAGKNLNKTANDLKNIGDVGKKSADKIGSSFSDASKTLSSFGGSVKDIRSSMLAASAAAAGVTVAVVGIGSAISKSLNSTSELSKLANMAGLSTTKFQELSYAARQFGAEQDAFTDGFKEMQIRAVDFITAGDNADSVFKRLGYSTGELEKKLRDTPALFNELIDKLRVLDTASRIQLADELFGGTGGEQFDAMIRAGSSEINRLTQSARDLGIVMDEVMVKRSIEAKNKLEALSTVLSSKLNVFLAELAPKIIEVSDSITTWISQNKELIELGMEKVLYGVSTAFDTVATSVSSVTTTFTILKGMWERLPEPLQWWLTSGTVEKVSVAYDSLKGISKNKDDGMKSSHKNYNLIDGLPQTELSYKPKNKIITSNKPKTSNGSSAASEAKRLEEEAKRHAERMEEISKSMYVRLLELQGKNKEAEIATVQDKYADLYKEAAGNKDLLKSIAENEGLEIAAIKKKYADEELANATAISNAIATMNASTAVTAASSVSERQAAELNQLKVAYEQDIANKEYTEEQKTAITAKYEAERAALIKDHINENDDILKEKLSSITDAYKTMASNLSSGLASAFTDFADGTKSAEDAFLQFASTFLSKIAEMIIQEQILKAIQGSSYSGSDTLGAITSAVTGFFGSANGNVFNHGNPVPFANGGIVSSPTIFPMANGGVGLMGEAGAEAIMPLQRTSSGKLGVAADVSGTSGSTVINVVNNFEGGDMGSAEDQEKMAANIKQSIIEVYKQEQAKDLRVGGSLYNYTRGYS